MLTQRIIQLSSAGPRLGSQGAYRRQQRRSCGQRRRHSLACAITATAPLIPAEDVVGPRSSLSTPRSRAFPVDPPTPLSTSSPMENLEDGSYLDPPADIPDNATYSTQPGPPRRTTRAQEQLRQLTAARQESMAAMQQARSTYNMGAAQAIDVRMYEQAVNARNRLSKKLSETNLYCDNLEERLLANTEQLMETQLFLKVVLSRMIEMRRLADSLHRAIKYSGDKETSLNRVKYMQDNMQVLDEELENHLKTFHSIVPRKVPVTWQGVASEVRVMGDFDRWTRGVLLSGEDITNDNVVATFQGELLLPPGKYSIKFLVDNEWRLAPDWPTEIDHLGETNNVVIVR